MADTTRRLSLHKPTGGDPAAVPADVGRLAGQLDDLLLGYDQGPLASRPASGVEGRLYYATDDAQLYYDTGSSWTPAANQPGDVIWTARSEASRLGWLVCDGAAVSRTTYAALFTAIGTAHGAGDGRTTFNVPDLRGRAPIGSGNGAGLSRRNRGEILGAETHLLATGELPAHAHTTSTSTVASHSHGGATAAASINHAHQSPDGRAFLTDRAGIGGGVYDLTLGPDIGNGGGGFTGSTDPVHAHGIAPDGSHSHTVTVNNAGGGGTHNNMQPSLVLNHFIKV